MVYVYYGSISGGSLPSVLNSYVRTLTQYVMMMIMGYAVQYVCFMKRKCFVRFLVSLTEPVAHKIIYCVVGKCKEKASDM